jgi:hypothetical protein
MMKFPFLAAALLATTLAVPVHAQDAPKKDQPIKPAEPPSKVVLDTWNDVGRKLIAMAEDFPEDKYDFKPTPAQRSFAEQLLHAAGANYFFTNLGAAVIKAKGDKGMNDLMVDPFAHQQTRVYDFAYGFIEHCGEHYGQLVVYYRLAGLVPPESRPKK